MKNRAVLYGVLFLLLISYAGAGAEVIPADRRIDWSKAGSKTDFSKRTTICTTLSPDSDTSDDSPRIEQAIADCPEGQVVKLNPGTFEIKSSISWGNNPRVTLRGSGKGVTILQGESGSFNYGFFDFYSGRNID